MVYSVNIIKQCALLFLIECTFQSEQVITDELCSLKTCLTINSIKESHPVVFFPAINLSTNVELPHSLVLSCKDTLAPESTITENTVSTMDSSLSSDILQPVEEAHSCGSASVPATLPYQGHVARFLEVLQDAVRRRVCTAPPVAESRELKGSHPDRAKLGNLTQAEGGTPTTSSEGELGVSSSDDVLRGHARVAILFSGGVDSAVLAALVDR